MCAIFCIATLLFSGRLNAQPTELMRGYMLSRRYAPVDYGSGFQNWWALEDNRGVMYFANLNGVLEFDGEQWRTYRVGRNAAVRCLAKDSQGQIYVGAYAEIGYMAISAQGALNYQSLLPQLDSRHANFRDIWCAHGMGDTMLFLSDATIFRYCNGRFTYFDSPQSAFYLAFVVDGVYYVQERGRGLLRLKGDSLEMVSNAPIFRNTMLHGLFPRSDGTMLVCTRHNGLHIYTPATGKIVPLGNQSSQAARIDTYFRTHAYYYGIALPNGTLALSSLIGSLLIVDADWNVVDVIDRNTRQSDGEVLFLYLASNNLLWLGLGDGLCQVEVLNGLRYWDRSLGIWGQISDAAYHNAYLYISTKQGIFRARKNPEVFGHTYFDRIDSHLESTYAFLQFPIGSNKSKLLVGSGTGVFQIDGNLTQRISSQAGVRSMHLLASDSSVVFTASIYGLGMMRYGRGRWEDKGLQFGIRDAVRGVAHDSIGNIWVATEGDGAYRISNYNPDRAEQALVEHFDTTSGYPQFDRVFIADGPIFVVNRDEVYTFDETTHRFSRLTMPTSTEAKPRSSSDFSKDFARFRRGAHSFMFYPGNRPDLGRWYNSVEGMMRFTHTHTAIDTFVPAPVIRHVSIDDSMLFHGNNFAIASNGRIVPNAQSNVNLNIVLSPKQGTLSLRYACPCFSREHDVEYSTRLAGGQQNWSDWTLETKKDYIDLPIGDYTFEVRARYLGQFVSAPASFSFTVRRNIWTSPILWGGILGVVLISLMLALWRSYTRNIDISHTIEEQDDIISQRNKELEERLEEIKAQADALSVREQQLQHSRNMVMMQRKYLINIKRELEESNKDKVDMIRTLAHDLRGAVAAWVMISDQMIAEGESLSRSDVNAYVEDINRHAHNTHDLLEQQLDWAAVHSHDIRYSPAIIPLLDAVNSVVHVLRYRLTDKQIELKIDINPDLTVWVDEYMLSAVLRNLLTNAIKFSHPNGQVRLTADVDGDKCKIIVADDGVGIDPEQLPNLFTTRRSTRGTNNERGLGVGLNVCKELVERNNGYISVQSAVGKGTAFTFTIPLTPPTVIDDDPMHSYIV